MKTPNFELTCLHCRKFDHKTSTKLSIVDTALIAEIEEFLSRYPEWDYLDAEVVWEALLVAKMGRSFSRAYLYRGYINRGFLMKEVINHV